MYVFVDEIFQASTSEVGFDIGLICQPPNSPDLNVLYLGFFFSTIQVLQQRKVTRTIDELIQHNGENLLPSQHLEGGQQPLHLSLVSLQK